MAFALSFLIALVIWATPARSDDQHQIVHDCMPDAVKYCAHLFEQMDQNRIIKCVLSHHHKLKPVCARHEAAVRKRK